MKAMENLKEVMEDAIKKIGKKQDITPQDLEYAYKAIDILKDIETIKAMKAADFGDGEYSQRGSYNSYEGGNSNRGSYANNQVSHENSNRGNSYSPIWNQDMMTPYSMNSYRGSYEGGSNDGNSMNSYRGSYDGSYEGQASREGSYEDYSERRGRDAMGRFTSRDGSYDYSRHSEKERMIDKLETMADVATDSKTKRAIEQCITKLEQ